MRQNAAQHFRDFIRKIRGQPRAAYFEVQNGLRFLARRHFLFFHLKKLQTSPKTVYFLKKIKKKYEQFFFAVTKNQDIEAKNSYFLFDFKGAAFLIHFITWAWDGRAWR